MITLGIDLSSQHADTAAALIEWKKGRAIAAPPEIGCTDLDLCRLIKKADVIGIDAPSGWPTAFVDAVRSWPYDDWSLFIRDRLRFRETDRFVHNGQGVWPLSVSTDRIALPAMRAVSLLRLHGVTDRSGDGRFFEVYPVASLREWRLPSLGYKDDKKSECRHARRDILASMQSAMPRLEVTHEYASTSDTLDALIASITARAAALSQTIRPTAAQLDLARCEGWIHIPNRIPKI